MIVQSGSVRTSRSLTRLVEILGQVFWRRKNLDTELRHHGRCAHRQILSADIIMIMKIKIVRFAALFFGAIVAAQAQLYIATGSTGVTTWFDFTIDPTLNRVTVLVDNTHPGTGGATGTVTSFGFNIPSTLVGTGSLLSSVGVPAGTWSFFEPYDLNAGGNAFQQDVGAGSGGNPNGGQPNESVMFGSTATFVFQFADFASASGFLGTNGVTARWQAIGPSDLSDQGFGVLGPPRAEGVVPEPSTYGLIGAAILVLGAFSRKIFSRTKALV